MVFTPKLGNNFLFLFFYFYFCFVYLGLNVAIFASGMSVTGGAYSAASRKRADILQLEFK